MVEIEFDKLIIKNCNNDNCNNDNCKNEINNLQLLTPPFAMFLLYIIVIHDC